MNAIMLMIPLIIILGIAFLATRLINQPRMKKGRYSYSKKVRVIFTGYVGILLICLVLTLILPTKELSKLEKITEHGNSSNLYQQALSGNINKVSRDHLVTERKLDYSGRTLQVKTKGDEFFDIPLIVERKPSNDNKIEAYYFRTTMSLNNYDVSDYVKAPVWDIKDDTFLLNMPKSSIKLSEFSYPFTVNQFTGKSLFSHSINSEWDHLIYIRIPKDLQLNHDDNLNMEYVK